METAVKAFFLQHGRDDTYEHCRRVARRSQELAAQFGLDGQRAHLAGLLHDISCVVPNNARLKMFVSRGLAVLPEEQHYPGLLHQRHSAMLASELFGVTDNDVLSAVGCHTTLKTNANELDKIVFLADKLSWDQDGEPPFLADVNEALKLSLNAGCLVYIEWLLGPQGNIVVAHPWLLAAHEELSRRCVEKQQKSTISREI